MKAEELFQIKGDKRDKQYKAMYDLQLDPGSRGGNCYKGHYLDNW